MLEMKDPKTDGWNVFPPAPRWLPADTLDVWAQYAQESDLHPLLRARLADLLWVRKHQPQHRWHEKAIAAYVEQVDQPETKDLDRENAAIRAVNLSRGTNQTALEQSAYDALRRLVVSLLEDDDGNYGPTARCLGHLAIHCQPCNDLLDQAIAKYKTGPHRHAELLQIKAGASTTQPDRTHCMTEAINILIADANSSPGLRQLVLLQEALALAMKEGLRVLTTDLEAQIARVNLEGEFSLIEASVKVPREEFDAMVQEVIGDADTLGDALNAFGRRIPISDVERNQKKVRDQIEATPLLYLLRRSSVASVGDQIAVTDVPAPEHPDFMEIEVRKCEQSEIQWFAQIVGRNVLRKIDTQYNPTIDELVEHFRCTWIPEDVARRIAKSYLHWRAEDQDSAVSVIVLTIEAVIRELAGAMGITLTRSRDGGDGQRVGEAVILGGLLARIAEHPTFQTVQIIPRYLESALTDRSSLNLRNDLTHALTDLTEDQYTILFHIICLLRSLADPLTQRNEETK